MRGGQALVFPGYGDEVAGADKAVVRGRQADLLVAGTRKGVVSEGDFDATQVALRIPNAERVGSAAVASTSSEEN